MLWLRKRSTRWTRRRLNLFLSCSSLRKRIKKIPLNYKTCKNNSRKWWIYSKRNVKAQAEPYPMPVPWLSQEKLPLKKALRVKKAKRATKADAVTTARQRVDSKGTWASPTSQSTDKQQSAHQCTAQTRSLQNCGRPTTQRYLHSVSRYQNLQETLVIRANGPQIILPALWTTDSSAIY